MFRKCVFYVLYDIVSFLSNLVHYKSVIGDSVVSIFLLIVVCYLGILTTVLSCLLWFVVWRY